MAQQSRADKIIVIGASSGGLAALRELLAHLPNDLRAAIIITMHIGDRQSLLPRLLTEASSMDIDFAMSEEQIKSGRIYVAPPDRHLLIKRGTLQLSRSAKENHSRPAIDPMFRSAAISYGNRTIGVVLTGELDDGVVGLQAIKAYGGMAFVQDPQTAEAPSMPMNALRHVEIDGCLPLDELGKTLGQTIQQWGTEAASPWQPRRVEPFATENELTEDLSSGGAYALEAVGEKAGMSCPECGGALWELGSTPLRFRCHTGHSYTHTVLSKAQNETVEEALWVAIRALHEKQLLVGRLIQNSKDSGRNAAVQEYELTNEELESHKTTLRALLAKLRPI
ncbi:chemotaxis protein CheB [Pseudomonas sp. SWRI154]|uniref:chemotaxis protein CheB n=1 Tax=Pseudomonas sp. SWRI154 TaxID=2745501 RepID=UPI0016456212|nr:chemotaxis protein CheB [Pseudomonas sp. SWRI154]MBC3361546.1 chemotaxis protein CheB [Pseudomonas sp. SWRI154]